MDRAPLLAGQYVSQTVGVHYRAHIVEQYEAKQIGTTKESGELVLTRARRRDIHESDERKTRWVRNIDISIQSCPELVPLVATVARNCVTE